MLSFLKKEPVLSAAAVCAVLSMFVVPPSAAYLSYIDVRVLCLLFCLMAIVAGLQSCGVFLVLAEGLLRGRKNMRLLSLLLVLLPFFSAMLITNDVALITFVPFTLLILDLADAKERTIPIVVLQTMAANLGSMATPVGNPQNLFLCAAYGLSAADFFGTMLPLTLVSLIGLSIGAMVTKSCVIEVHFPEKSTLINPKKLLVYVVLFFFSLLSVFHVLHYGILTVLVLICIAVLQPQILKKVDYKLLLTFVFFFLFAGNMGEIPALQHLLAGWMEKNAALTSLFASQIISNVPAAVLLAGFTDQWQGLLTGVNIGGLGTPIASLASLISLRFYCASPQGRTGAYLKVFTACNVAGLVILYLFYVLF